MKWLLLLFFLSLFLWFSSDHPGTKEDLLDEDKILFAVKKAEGSRVLYGIKGCQSSQCKRIALKTIHHYWKEYKIHGGRNVKDFILYASRRYVDGNDRIGQERWFKNVTYFYYKGDKK